MDGTFSLYCDVCSKRFSGHVPAQQHFASSQHLKKLQNSQLYQGDLSTYCKVCNKSCDTVQMLEIHNQSPRHLAMVEKRRELSTTLEPGQAPSTAVPTMAQDTPPDSEYVFNGSRGICYICNIDLTSESHANSHINGKNHLKKKVLWQASRGSAVLSTSHLMQSNVQNTPSTQMSKNLTPNLNRLLETSVPGTRVTDVGSYTCQLCNITCTGPENEAMHKSSEKHKKAVKLREMEREGKLLPLNCNACGCSFTGQECAEQHFNSAKHKQKEASANFHQQMSAKKADTRDKFTNQVNASDDVKSRGHDYISDGNDTDTLLIKPIPSDRDDLVLKPVPPSSSDHKMQPAFPLSHYNAQSVAPSIPNNAPVGLPVVRTVGKGRGIIALQRNIADVTVLNEESDLVCNNMNNMYTNNGLRNKNMKYVDVEVPEEVAGIQTADRSASPEISHIGIEADGYERLSATVYKKMEPVDSSLKVGKMEYKFQVPDVTPSATRCGSAFGQERKTDEEKHYLSEISGPMGTQEYIFDEKSGRGKCFACSIELTSRNHMHEHVEGKNHLRATKIWAVQNSSNGSDLGAFLCKVCHVTFSGPEPQQQHFESAKHKSKVQQLKSGDRECFCDICNVSCSGEASFQQHLAGAQHRKQAGSNVSIAPNLSMDRTVWHECKPCRCRLNSSEQLRIHEQSPKHRENVRKCSMMNNSSPRVSIDYSFGSRSDVSNLPVSTQDKCSTGGGLGYNTTSISPLDAFLSEELFPKEFLPENLNKVKVTNESKDTNISSNQVDQRPFTPVKISNEPVPLITRYTTVDTNSASEGAGTDMEKHGNVNRGQKSDLAWATRNKGQGSNKLAGNNARGEGSNLSALLANQLSLGYNDTTGIGRGQILNALRNNPHAATHPYYCHSCKVAMNTRETYESHLKGKRHMQKVCTEVAPYRQHLPPRSMGELYLPQTATTPRNYQMELYKKAMKNDTLCFLPTGTGKTLVSVLTISSMLDRHPTKNVLFLVDKVLLVIQQAKYIRKELQDIQFYRYNTENSPYSDVEQRQVQVAAVCMGQQNTNGIPLWKHDIVVVTAAFCQNLLEKDILRWTDFSLVVFDEAHHCEKRHPFNVLLERFHLTALSDRPKVLGLTASPAGKSDVPQTVQMLQSLISNMGNVSMSIVEEPDNVVTLNQFQSNAKMIISCHDDVQDSLTETLKTELYMYIAQCYNKLSSMSDMKNYADIKFSGMDIRTSAINAIENNFDLLQSSIDMAQSNSSVPKVDFLLFTKHVQCICMILSSLLEGGPQCAVEECKDMENTDANFDLAKRIGLQVDELRTLLTNQSEYTLSERRSAPEDSHISRLISELTSSRGSCENSISLVLVKERGTAHKLTKLLQNSEEMKRARLCTTTVVGHGGGGSGEKGMSVGQQKRTLEEIKQGLYQVIIATSVAEEGVDWPECERVISLYPPSTVTALVQMRGRARKKDSKFIVLCSKQEEQDKLDEIIKREKNMIIATQQLVQESYNDSRYYD